MKSVGHHHQNDPFSRSNDPQNSVVEFRRQFCQKISWTSVKTFAMEPIGLDVQNGPFSWSNELRSRKNPLFYRISCAIVHHLFLVFELRNKAWTLMSTKKKGS
ncbi:hypothetical protein H5410_031973 [Solanum commersonii]|uniref:Uncharacterized protein n=1 Tax=Solanum commersonii TaxID=4109 RepID=A0A9J5YIN5_SOLCO|nr:hypothetical protein H5410_031973 [Solanum commersonii]